MGINLYALDDIQNDNKAIAALENYADTIIDAFLEEPEGLEYIKKNPDEEEYVGEWFLKVLELAYSTGRITLPHITGEVIESLLTQALVETLAADDIKETGNLIPELVAFWSFLDRAYELSPAPSVLKSLKSLKPSFPDILKSQRSSAVAPISDSGPDPSPEQNGVERNSKDAVINSNPSSKSALNDAASNPDALLTGALSALNLGNSSSRSSSLDFDVDEVDFDIEMQKLEQELALETDESDGDLQKVLSSELEVTIAPENLEPAEGKAVAPDQPESLEQGSGAENLASEDPELADLKDQLSESPSTHNPDSELPDSELSDSELSDSGFFVTVAEPSVEADIPPMPVIPEEAAVPQEPFPPLNESQIDGLTQQTITDTEPGPILQDVSTFLKEIGAKGITISNKTQTLSMKLLAGLNEKMSEPHELGLKRPVQKNYGNIHGLILLLRTVGLIEVTQKGKKALLTLQPETIKRWKALNPTEQYCSLLTAWFLDANIALFDGRRSSKTEGDRVTSVWNRWFASGHPAFQNTKKDSESFATLPGLHNLSMMQLLGLVDVQSGPPQDGQGWQINAICQTRFGNALMTEIMRMKKRDDVVFNGQQPSSEPNPIQTFLRPYFPEWSSGLDGPLPDMPEPVIPEPVVPESVASEPITPAIESPLGSSASVESSPVALPSEPSSVPEELEATESHDPQQAESIDPLVDLLMARLTARSAEDPPEELPEALDESLVEPLAEALDDPLAEPLDEPPVPQVVQQPPVKRGVYVFKVTLQEAERWIAIGSEQTLFNLSQTILDSVRFDNDHLDLFRYNTVDGVVIEVTHPYNQGDRSTDSTLVRELGLMVGSTMTYLFDFNQNWQFTLEVESIDPEDMRLKYLDVVDSQGDAPEQYGSSLGDDDLGDDSVEDDDW